MAERYARALVDRQGAVEDELTMGMQDVFSPEEFADLTFSIGYFIGMQYVGKAMHWDNACPIAHIRDAGD
jgi:hypothetical protein